MVRLRIPLAAGAIVMAAVLEAGANPAGTAPEARGPLPVSGTVAFMAVEPAGRLLRVSVIQGMAAAPDHVIPGTGHDRVAFPLPEVAPPPRRSEAVDLVGGWRRPQVVNGVITDAVPPLSGGAEVAYAWVFEPRGETATLRWVLPYGATDIVLLVPEHGIRVSETGLHADGVVTERGRRYARWSGGPAAPGDAVSVRLDGLSAPDGRWPELAAGLLAVVLAGGLIAALRRRSASAQTEGEWAV
ncbi:MAG TPA: hypothetical protein VGX75_01485 [bacterium]|nr:hypothetical protein [bacterium]